MGFPSPATDYQENRLSLDQHCNTGAPGVFFFRSDTYSFREGIKPGALLIVEALLQIVGGDKLIIPFC